MDRRIRIASFILAVTTYGLAQIGPATAAPVDDAGRAAPNESDALAALDTASTEFAVQHVLRGPETLPGSDGGPEDYFGRSVAVLGDVALVGADGDDIGGSIDQGSVYAYVREGGEWRFEQKLIASDGRTGDGFGASLAFDGVVLAVGAPGWDSGGVANRGAVYLFRRANGGWATEAKLLATDAAATDRFGRAVAIDGATVVVGTPFADVDGAVNRGAAYVFARTGTAWLQQAKLLAPQGGADDQFGFSVAIDGATVLAGARREAVGSIQQAGAAHVFIRSGETWTHDGRVVSPDSRTGMAFGSALALDGGTAIVGAPGDDAIVPPQAGAAYAYTRASGWTLQARLQVPGTGSSYRLGRAIAMSGDTAVVTMGWDAAVPDAPGGSARVFVRDGVDWTHTAVLTLDGDPGHSQVGSSVALDSNSVIVGAVFDRPGPNGAQGSALSFVRSASGWSSTARLTTGDASAFDKFGWSVAVHGDAAMVGVGHADVGVNESQGVVYAYRRQQGSWHRDGTFSAADAGLLTSFGGAVAMYADLAVIGATGMQFGASEDRWGAAYVFGRTGDGWSQRVKLVPAVRNARDGFGTSVAVAGSMIAVGAPTATAGGVDFRGAVSVYGQQGDMWVPNATLTTPRPTQLELFGHAVAVWGDRLLVGAPSIGDGNVGQAYMYRRRNDDWELESTLQAQDGTPADWFGRAVALHSGIAVIGAEQADHNNGFDQGAAYVFVLGSDGWSQRAKLVSRDGADNDRYGSAVAVDGVSVMIGAGNANVGYAIDRGYVDIWRAVHGDWRRLQRIMPDGGQSDDMFGYAVAIDGETAIVGAIGTDGAAPHGNPDEGSAYILASAAVFVNGFESVDVPERAE